MAKWLKRKGQVEGEDGTCPKCGMSMVRPEVFPFVQISWSSTVEMTKYDLSEGEPESSDYLNFYGDTEIMDSEQHDSEIHCAFCNREVTPGLIDGVINLRNGRPFNYDAGQDEPEPPDLTQADIDLGELEIPE